MYHSNTCHFFIIIIIQYMPIWILLVHVFTHYLAGGDLLFFLLQGKKSCPKTSPFQEKELSKSFVLIIWSKYRLVRYIQVCTGTEHVIVKCFSLSYFWAPKLMKKMIDHWLQKMILAQNRFQNHFSFNCIQIFFVASLPCFNFQLPLQLTGTCGIVKSKKKLLLSWMKKKQKSKRSDQTVVIRVINMIQFGAQMFKAWKS